jgi:MYXO-CTERM domain-containing protein
VAALHVRLGALCSWIWLFAAAPATTAAQVREPQVVGGVPVLGHGVASAAELRNDYRYLGPTSPHPGCAIGAPAFVAIGSELVAGCTELVRGPALDELARVFRFPDGTVRHRDDLVRHARGRVYDPNPVVASFRTTDAELVDLVATDSLAGRFVRALSCPAEGACDPIAIARPDAGGDFFFEPTEPALGDPFAEVSAYFHATRAVRYFAGAHGFSWAACSDPSRALDVIASYRREPGVPYDNAAFLPGTGPICPRVVLGQGEHDYAYDGDIVYHEVSHAVIEALASFETFREDELGVAYDPAAVSEGYADYFSATLAGDPFVAEYIDETLPADPPPPPPLDAMLSCARDRVGEPHYDGRIFAAALWALREALDAERADAIAFRSLALQGESTTLDDAFAILDAALSDLSPPERDEARTILDRHRGEGCAPLVDLAEPRLGWSGSPNAPRTGGLHLAPLQYRGQPGSMVRLEPIVGPARYRVLVRCGAPVSPDVFDGEGPEIDRGCVAPHVALVVDDLEANGAGFFRISLEPSDALHAGGGGCGCAASPTSPSLAALALLGYVFASRRRSCPKSSSTRSLGAATASWPSASWQRKASSTARSTSKATKRSAPG